MSARRMGCSVPVEDKLWAKVDRTGGPESCWQFVGAHDAAGYGSIRVSLGYGQGSRAYRTHRLAFELTYGPIPDGLYVCHRCDYPPCCNPAHLFAGTAGQNMADCHAKGRNARMARLIIPPRRADEMVQRYVAGESLRRIAAALNCHSTTVLAHLQARGVTMRPQGRRYP